MLPKTMLLLSQSTRATFCGQLGAHLLVAATAVNASAACCIGNTTLQPQLAPKASQMPLVPSSPEKTVAWAWFFLTFVTCNFKL